MRPAARWLPAVVWTLCVLAGSADLLGAPRTGSWLAWVLSLAGLPANAPWVQPLHFLLRKGGHLAAYGLLAGLWYRAFRGGRQPRFRWRWALQALAAAVLTACADEWMQTAARHRTGSPLDVLLDTAGAAGILAAIRRRSRLR